MKKNLLKKMTVTMISLMLLLVITACGTSATNTADSAASGNSEKASEVEKAVIETEADATANTTSAVSGEAASAALGDYDVTIKSAELGQDENGKDVIVVTYEWTNNSEKAISFTDALYAEAYQNAVECDYSFLDGEDLTMTEVEPGETLEVQEPYLIQDKTNPVDISVSNLDSDQIVTTTFAIAQ